MTLLPPESRAERRVRIALTAMSIGLGALSVVCGWIFGHMAGWW